MARVFRRERSEVVGTFGYFEVERHDLEVTFGERVQAHSVFTVRAPDWVSVAAVSSDGRFILVRQHRHGIDGETLETAGGIIDEGESPAVAALRELREETGFVASKVESLGVVHPNPALQSNRCFLFLARGAEDRGELDTDEHEHTEPVVMSRAEVESALAQGKITHALAVLALERAFLALGAKS